MSTFLFRNATSQSIIRTIIITFTLCRPLRVWAYRPTAGLISTCLQAVMKDHPANIWMPCGQHFESPAVVGFQARITATNQWIPKFSILLSWQRYALPGIEPVDSCVRGSESPSAPQRPKLSKRAKNDASDSLLNHLI